MPAFLVKTAFICGLMLSLAPVTAAAEALLYVSPHRVILTDQAPSTKVNITNRSDKYKRYTLSLVDNVMTESGTTERVDTYPYSAKRIVRFVPRDVTLAPGERQVVRIMARRSSDLEDGDYHSHLLFREADLPEELQQKEDARRQAAAEARGATPGRATFEIGTRFGLGIPVIVRRGEVHYSLGMDKVALTKTDNGADALAVTFARGGNIEGTGYLTTTYTPAGGEAVAATNPQYIRVYRERDFINQTILLALPEGVALNGGELRLALHTGPEPNAQMLDEAVIAVP